MLTDRLLALFGLDFDFSSNPFSERFSKINDDLFLGVRPLQDDTPALRAAGVTHVVSAIPANKQDELDYLKADFQTCFLALDDRIDADIASQFGVYFRFVETALGADGKNKVLVHCEAGVSRSATLVIAWLMKQQGMCFFDAFSAVKARRARALPNIGFASQLQRFEFALMPELAGRSDSLARYLHTYCNAPVTFEALCLALQSHDYDALKALQSIFGQELPRVIQGVKA